MIKFSKLNVEQKMETTAKMDKSVPPNATVGELRTFKALKGWCGMNVMVGDELAPPTLEHLKSYIV